MQKRTLEKKAKLLTPEKKAELELAARLLNALQYGPVNNFGMFGVFRQHPLPSIYLRFSGAEMHTAVRCLQRLGFPVERTDSGGNPQWELIK